MKKNRLSIEIRAFAGAIVFIAFFFTGCRKEDKTPPSPQGQYYFSAKLNGEQKDFLHSAQFQYGEKDGKLISIIIAGYDGKYDLSKPIEERSIDLQLEIFRYDMKDISPAKYTEIASTTSTYRVDCERHIQKRNQQGETYTLQYDEEYLNDLTITITEVSRETGIKGTFSGKMRFETSPFDVINVTDGQFYFPYNDDLLNP